VHTNSGDVDAVFYLVPFLNAGRFDGGDEPVQIGLLKRQPGINGHALVEMRLVHHPGAARRGAGTVLVVLAQETQRQPPDVLFGVSHRDTQKTNILPIQLNELVLTLLIDLNHLSH
jgi:hypothetical protein